MCQSLNGIRTRAAGNKPLSVNQSNWSREINRSGLSAPSFLLAWRVSHRPEFILFCTHCKPIFPTLSRSFLLSQECNLCYMLKQRKSLSDSLRGYRTVLTEYQSTKSRECLVYGADKTKWWTSTINKILRNEEYIGDALLQKTYTTDFLNKTRVRTMASFRNTMWKTTTKQSFRRTSSCGSCGYRKNWYADEWSIQALMAKNAATAATTALHRLSFAANAVKCSAEFTRTIAAANPSSGAASVDWN